MPTKRRKLVLLSWIASVFCISVEAGLAVESQHAEQDDDGFVFQLLPQHTTTPQRATTSNKFALRMPQHVVILSKRVKSMDVDATFLLDSVWEDDEEYLPFKTGPKTSKSRSNTVSLPRAYPLLNSGLAAVVIASIVSTSNGFNSLKELAIGGVSALALVWVPTLLTHGGWPEFLCGALFLTHPASRRFVTRTLIPKTFSTLKKLVLSELWRTLWAIVLAPLPRPLLVPSNHAILQMQWIPDDLKERFLYFRDKVDSFVLSTVKGYVQKSVHGSMGIFYDSFSGTVMEVSLYEESVAVDSNDLNQESDGDLSDDDSDGDASHEPQVVCDGDVCWLE